jgi:MFS family permease
MIELLRRNRDIRLLFFAQVISYAGDWFAYVALAGLIKDATDNDLLVALVLVAFSLPSFLLSPLGGPVADRFDRRRVLVIVSVLQVGAAAGLLLANEGRVWPAFVFQALISGLAAFVRPCVEAALPNLTTSDAELRRAAAVFGSVWGVMMAVGAALGGIVSAAFGRDVAFIVNAISFVAAAVLFAGIRSPMQQHATTGSARAQVRPLADMREAIRFARRDNVVLALLASKATFAVGAGVVGQYAVLAKDQFASGDRGSGLLVAARGVGSGLGPIVAARYISGRRRAGGTAGTAESTPAPTPGDGVRRVLIVCGGAGLMSAVCYVAAAWSPTIWLAACALVVAHFAGGAQWTTSTYGLQLRTPDDMRGRVMAGDFAIVTLMLSVTSLAAGLLSEAMGVRPAITTVSAGAALAALAYLVSTRRLRAMTDEDR